MWPFSKRKISARSDVQQRQMDPTEVRIAVEQMCKKMIGEELPLAAKMVSNELLGSNPVQYKISPNPQAIRLGVLHFFALLVTFLDLKHGFGTILTELGDDNYNLDNYGSNKISAKEFMSTFGMDIITVDDLRSIPKDEIGKQAVFNGKNGVVIASKTDLHTAFNGWPSPNIRSRFPLPIIKDDGIILTRSEPTPLCVWW